jgi:betaine reductase
MDLESQAQIKKIVEENGKENTIVVLGASDVEGSEIAAETLTSGDPSFAGPLAGVSLDLPVYHIFEPEVMEAIPKEIYDRNVEMIRMTVDTEEVAKKFKAIRLASIKK